MFWKKSQKSFFDYFEEHAAEITKSSALLQELFLGKNNPFEISKQIKAAEHTADNIIYQVIKQMNANGFILPIDREDIFSFTRALDDVIDQIKDCAEAYAEIYTLQEATQHAHRFAEIIQEGTRLLNPICKDIRNPSQHGAEILHYCAEIRRLENEGDAIKKESLHWIFERLKKNEISQADFTAWNDLYRSLELITDKVEDCADIAEQMVLKYS